MQTARTDHIRLLSLDGGGIRGLSELLILEEIMERIKVELNLDTTPIPADYFDLIGGTSTGGLIAILLTRLRLSAAEAITEYERLAERVFSHKKMLLMRSEGIFDSTRLVKAFKDSVKSSGRDEDALMFDDKDSYGPCKGFVCAVTAPNVTAAAGPTLFRTYRVTKNNSYNCKIWEAARATSAATTVFDRIAIGPQASRIEYLDAGLGYNNPIDLVIEESSLCFGSQANASCILSIGTGEMGATGYAQPKGFQKLLPTKLVNVLKDIATNCGRKAEECAKRFSGREIYFRFNVSIGLEKIPLAEWKDMGLVRAHTQNYMKLDLVSSEIDKVVQALIRQTDPRASVYSLAELGLVLASKRPRYFLFPSWRLGNYSVCRDDIIAEIEMKAAATDQTSDRDAPRCIVLRGIGGSGKSHIALEFCHLSEKSGQYQAIFWLDATSMQTLVASFADVYKLLFPGSPEDSDNVRLSKIKETIEAWRSPWLLVFDGLDCFDDFNRNVCEFWPMSRFGTIVITSRHAQAELLGDAIRVDRLSDDQAIKLLHGKDESWSSSFSDEEILQVAQELGGLCLPIAQARAYMQQHRLSPSKFLSEYHVRQKKILETVPNAALWEYRKTRTIGDEEVRTALSVFTTWELSLQDLTGDKDEKKCKLTALTLLVLLGTDSIVDIGEIFERYAQSPKQQAEWLRIFMEEGSWSGYAFRDVLDEFRDLSLIEEIYDAKDKPQMFMHRIVRDWVKLRLKAASLRDSTKEACFMALAWIEDPQTKRGSWKIDEPYILKQHALIVMVSCVSNCDLYLEPGEVIGFDDLHEFGMAIFQYFANEGWYKDLLPWAQKALARSEEAFGRWNMDTLELLEVVACLHRQMDHFEEYYKLGKWAFDSFNQVSHDPTYPKLQALMSRLKSLVSDVCILQLNFDDGELLLETAYEDLKELLGKDHRSTLEAYLALARYYIIARRLNEAMTICAITAALSDATFLSAMGKARARLLAAQIYIEKRHFFKAYNEISQLRFLCQVCYGPQHHEHARWMHLSAILDLRCGKFDAAAEMLEHAVKIRERNLGLEHHDTIESQIWWARALMELGRYQQARDILKQAEESWSKMTIAPLFLFSSPTRALIELDIIEARSRGSATEALATTSVAIAKFRGNKLRLPPSEYPMLIWRGVLLSYILCGPRTFFEIQFPDIGSYHPDAERELDVLMHVAERLEPRDDRAALLLFYCTAQNLFALLGNMALADKYSLKLIQVAKKQSRGESSEPSVLDEALQTPLPRPFISLCDFLLEDLDKNPYYSFLGKVLIQAGDMDGTQRAYESTPATWVCDMCTPPKLIQGPIYICASCPDISLCMACYGLYKSHEVTDHTLGFKPLPDGCRKHGFISVPRMQWEMGTGSLIAGDQIRTGQVGDELLENDETGVNDLTDENTTLPNSQKAWLLTLKTKHSSTEFPQAIDLALSEFELAPFEIEDLEMYHHFAKSEIELELDKGRLEHVKGWWVPSGPHPRRVSGDAVYVEPGNLVLVGDKALLGESMDWDV